MSPIAMKNHKNLRSISTDVHESWRSWDPSYMSRGISRPFSEVGVQFYARVFHETSAILLAVIARAKLSDVPGVA